MSDNTVNMEMTTLDISWLVSGMPYQRPVDERNVKRLIDEWDLSLMDPPVVSFRDGSFNLVEGQHRVIALRRIYGDNIKVPCKIHYGLTYQQEAELCYKLDQAKKRLSTAQAINALVEAESDPDIMEIQRLVEANGFIWALDKKIPGEYEIIAVRAVINAYKLLGAAAFDRIGRIADRLNQMGVLSPMEHKRSQGLKFDTVFKRDDTAKWSYKAIQRILTNEVYIGVLAQGKRGRPTHKVRTVQKRDESEWVKVENAHEALISHDDFMVVQTMMKRDMRCGADQEEVSTLSGFLFCGDCGRSMIRKTVPSKTKKYFYYICSGSKRSHSCTQHSISASEVEQKVFRTIHDQIELVVNLERVLEMIDRLPAQDRKALNYEAQIVRLEEEIELYQKRKLRLYEDLSDGIIDKADYYDFRDSFNRVIEDKQTALRRVRTEMREASVTGTTERNWITLFKQYENIEELNRRVLIALVDKILIYENHVIEICFKYRDEYEHALAYALNYSDKLLAAG